MPCDIAGVPRQSVIQLIDIIIQFALIAEVPDAFLGILHEGGVIGSGFFCIGSQKSTPVFFQQFACPVGPSVSSLSKWFSPHVGCLFWVDVAGQLGSDPSN